MGDRTPGVVGLDPFAEDAGARVPGKTPSAGWTDSGPIGLDAGSGTTAPVSLQISGWPRSISWDEFKELPARPPDETEDAQIHSEVDQPSRVGVVREHGVFRVTSLTVTLRTVSEDNWVVTAQKSDDLLSHEQGHYDITGLTGRDMGNEIVAVRAHSRADLQTKVTQIIEKYRRLAKALSGRYDTETDHSRNGQAQERWDDAIHAAMKSGDPFSGP
jgi:Bacterial protein of unknown function (DUF922)